MNRLLETLSEKERQLIVIKEYKKGEIIHYEDDICNEVSIIINGYVIIKSNSFNDKEIIFNSIFSGMVFGNNLIFSSNPKYKGDVLIKENSVIGIIKKDPLIYLLQNNELFLLEYMKLQSDFSKSLNNKIKTLSFESAEERFLFHLESSDGQIRYKTITDLAKELYVTRETLSRVISKLQKENVIKIYNKIISKM